MGVGYEEAPPPPSPLPPGGRLAESKTALTKARKARQATSTAFHEEGSQNWNMHDWDMLVSGFPSVSEWHSLRPQEVFVADYKKQTAGDGNHVCLVVSAKGLIEGTWHALENKMAVKVIYVRPSLPYASGCCCSPVVVAPPCLQARFFFSQNCFSFVCPPRLLLPP